MSLFPPPKFSYFNSLSFAHHLNFLSCFLYFFLNYFRNLSESSLNPSSSRSILFQWNFLIFLVNILFLWNSLIYFGLFSRRFDSRKSWTQIFSSIFIIFSLDGVAEFLNFLGCAAYFLSSTFPLFGYFLSLSDARERRLDELIYFFDVFAMSIFVFDSILFIAIFAREFEFSHRKSFWRGIFTREVFFSWDFIPLALNFLAGEFYLIAVLYGLIIRLQRSEEEIIKNEESEIWQKNLANEGEVQRSIEFVGDFLYVVCSIAVEIGFFIEKKNSNRRNSEIDEEAGELSNKFDESKELIYLKDSSPVSGGPMLRSQLSSNFSSKQQNGNGFYSEDSHSQ